MTTPGAARQSLLSRWKSSAPPDALNGQVSQVSSRNQRDQAAEAFGKLPQLCLFASRCSMRVDELDGSRRKRTFAAVIVRQPARQGLSRQCVFAVPGPPISTRWARQSMNRKRCRLPLAVALVDLTGRNVGSLTDLYKPEPCGLHVIGNGGRKPPGSATSAFTLGKQSATRSVECWCACSMTVR